VNRNEREKRRALRTPIVTAATRAVREIDAVSDLDTTWLAQAACGNVPTSTADAMRAATTREHGEVLGWRCDRCPVAWQCLGEGLRTRGSGIWGGFVLGDGQEVAL
jgi:hypothetical protein